MKKFSKEEKRDLEEINGKGKIGKNTRPKIIKLIKNLKNDLRVSKKELGSVVTIHPAILAYKGHDSVAALALVSGGTIHTKDLAKEQFDEKDDLFCQEVILDPRLFGGDNSLALDDAWLDVLQEIIAEEEQKQNALKQDYMDNFKKLSLTISAAWKKFPELVGIIIKPLF